MEIFFCPFLGFVWCVVGESVLESISDSVGIVAGGVVEILQRSKNAPRYVGNCLTLVSYLPFCRIAQLDLATLTQSKLMSCIPLKRRWNRFHLIQKCILL